MRRENNAENIQHIQHSTCFQLRITACHRGSNFNVFTVTFAVKSSSASWCWCAYATSLHCCSGGNVSSHDHMLPRGLWLILTSRVFRQRVNSTNMFSLCEYNQLIFSRSLNDGGAVKLFWWVFQRQWRGSSGGGRGLGGNSTRLWSLFGTLLLLIYSHKSWNGLPLICHWTVK